MFNLIALISGLLFGAGMMVSGMVDPNNVIGFLDIAGDWNPSLAFVMGGALLVFIPAYVLLIKPRRQPICDTDFQLAVNSRIDRKLLLGASLFGIGWGVAGICPGPAITLLGSASTSVFAFVIAMLVGQRLAGLFTHNKVSQQ
uniref:YeeE/YedE family protein n=1 Tax=Thaumasiovibrio occultus TaxID=1891184 RepID=UPI000B359305|nr:YeeE/YedE family protein [Thaumasiovibrio occultus]